MHRPPSIRSRALAAFAVLIAAPAMAQPGPPPAPSDQPEMRANCPGLVAGRSTPIPAAFKTSLADDQVRITYLGHSTFLIESPRLVRIATDYNDYVRPPVLPDIVTMNHAHATHYTDHPDPGIKYVLRGWRDDGQPAGHDMSYQDVRVRSVATNIRDFAGGTERHGNSIFVFEVAGLCNAHLGHLQHTLTQQQLDEIGRVDVVMVPVDGSYTIDLDGVIELLQSLKAPLMIPMHYFSAYTLDRFLARVREQYAIEYAETPSTLVSKATLPSTPRLVVLPGR
jgi:L-ascorbate metabolism protein UlaG (beta-lactamase superfamily)